MAISLYGISDDDAIDLLEEWKTKKIKLIQTFDDLHARFEEIVERDSKDVEDWIYSSAIGRFLAEAEDAGEPSQAIRLPGAYNQLPIDYMIAYREHRDEGDLLVPLYRPTSTLHAHLNASLLGTRNQIIAKCENIQHAAIQCDRAGNRLNAAASLIASLEEVLSTGVVA